VRLSDPDLVNDAFGEAHMVDAVLARMFLALKREEGQAMAEYGIILALIAAVVIALLVTLGGQIKDALQTVVDAL